MVALIKIISLLLIFISAAHATPIYKSVDESGRVTYSSTPPENRENYTKVYIQPPPSEEQIEAARQDHERNLKAAELLDLNRKKRNELIAEENRIKLERQKQLQKKTQQEKPKDNIAYPYYLPRYPGVIVPPGRPITKPPSIDHPTIDRPIINRPVHLPAR